MNQPRFWLESLGNAGEEEPGRHDERSLCLYLFCLLLLHGSSARGPGFNPGPRDWRKWQFWRCKKSSILRGWAPWRLWFVSLQANSVILWMDEILHHVKTMGNQCLLVFTGESSFYGFSGDAGFRPSTVCLCPKSSLQAPKWLASFNFRLLLTRPRKSGIIALCAVSISWIRHVSDVPIQY